MINNRLIELCKLGSGLIWINTDSSINPLLILLVLLILLILLICQALLPPSLLFIIKVISLCPFSNNYIYSPPTISTRLPLLIRPLFALPSLPTAHSPSPSHIPFPFPSVFPVHFSASHLVPWDSYWSRTASKPPFPRTTHETKACLLQIEKSLQKVSIQLDKLLSLGVIQVLIVTKIRVDP